MKKNLSLMSLFLCLSRLFIWGIMSKVGLWEKRYKEDHIGGLYRGEGSNLQHTMDFWTLWGNP